MLGGREKEMVIYLCMAKVLIAKISLSVIFREHHRWPLNSPFKEGFLWWVDGNRATDPPNWPLGSEMWLSVHLHPHTGQTAASMNRPVNHRLRPTQRWARSLSLTSQRTKLIYKTKMHDVAPSCRLSCGSIFAGSNIFLVLSLRSNKKETGPR